MLKAIKVINKKTGLEFDANVNLIAYAKGDPGTYKIVYEEDNSPKPLKAHDPDDLKAMSMKDLQKLADGLDCDKRRKDSLIDAILEAGR